MPVQRYVSPELTLFVGQGLPEEQQYSVLVDSILRAGWLKTHPRIPDPQEMLETLGMVGGPPKDPTDVSGSWRVCFGDIPVTDLEIHMNKYSRFGLSFLKPFLVNKGANPVLYVADNSPAISLGLPVAWRRDTK